MTFSLTLFVTSWVCFLIFSKKNKLRLFYSTCLLAMYLASIVDLLGGHHFPLWDYPDPSNIHAFIYHVLQQFGVYPVVVYLFLQTLPKQQNLITMSLHIFYWSIIALVIEWIAIKTGFMKYKNWWNLGWSYLADWILYFIFYWHHKWWNKIN
jgi:hypothetical protein